jgi:hypothetical protein
LVAEHEVLAIGATGLPAQPAAAQDPTTAATGGVGWIGPREDAFRDRFRQLLLAVPTRDLPAGWQLAADLGQPAAPLLWDMVRAEKSNAARRLTVATAAIAAGGTNEDERVFAWLDNQKAMLEERVLAAMLMALGPRRQRAPSDYWSRCFGPDRTVEQILNIAARLASVRFPETAATAPSVLDDDPGVAAATAYAGLPIGAPLATRLWNLGDPPRHAELFWRGTMLAAAREAREGAPPGEVMLQRARRLSALAGQQHAAVRASAALLRMRANDQHTEGPRPEWRMLEIAAGSTQSARSLQGWLGPVPQPRDDEPQRLAVAYVLSRDPVEVVGDRSLWGTDARIRRHVAVALAWNLLGNSPAQPIDVDVPSLPEWGLVRWAAGGTLDDPTQIEDPQLQIAARVAAAGRMPREVMRGVLEEVMWKWGSHPGLGAWELERQLIRDLLLVGSNIGGGKYQPHVRPEQRYRAAGIGPDAVFFEIAVAWFDFSAQPRGAPPAEYRLR